MSRLRFRLQSALLEDVEGRSKRQHRPSPVSRVEKEANRMSSAVQYIEDWVRRGMVIESPEVTPESAIVGVDTNSMAGSSTCIFSCFEEAVAWFWQRCEEIWGSGDEDHWIPDDEAPPELREGRQRFRRLLARFLDEGYSPAIADEFRDIVGDLQDSVQVGSVEVLPTDLEGFLDGWRDDWGYDNLDDPDVYAEYVKKAASYGSTVLAAPPDEPFDLSNPQHLAGLETYLKRMCEL